MSKQVYGDPEQTPLEVLARLVWIAKHARERFDAVADNEPAHIEAGAWSNYRASLDEVFEHIETMPDYDEAARKEESV